MSSDLKSKLIIIGIGIVLRVCFFGICSSDTIDFLTQRVEFLSSLTSYSRMVEGKFLVSTGKELYVSDFFRLNPLVGAFVFPVIGSQVLTFALATCMDALTAFLLMETTGPFHKIAGMLYLLNPYTIVSPSALSLQSLHILVMVLVLYATYVRKSVNGVSFALAFAVLLKPVLPIVLIFPISVCLGTPVWRIILWSIFWFIILQILSFSVTGFSWSYFHPTVVAPLLISGDNEPSMSLAWSLFTVVLKESLWFFRIAYHTHLLFTSALVHVRSTTVNYSLETKQRFMTLMVCAVLLFQQSATAIDHCLTISLILACDETRYLDTISTQFTHIIMAGLIFSSAMAPLWIDKNTANMNFLFYMGMVIFFAGVISITQGLRLARLDGYSEKDKKQQ